MYAYIKGKLEDVFEDHLVIDVSGIGYEIYSPNPYNFQRQIEQEVKIYTYFHVREDAQILYGFKEQEEKSLFKKLLNVSGIGPKNALSIVGQTSAHDFALAIEHEDDGFLTNFPGVGKKTARQMILDLKGKVDEWMHSGGATMTEPDAGSVNITTMSTEGADEALEALKALGYSSREINRISGKLKAYDGHSTDDFVKKGLQLLTSKR
ncbi:Holliday junction branch migration protein RuvA [Halalkalibacillus sediminis]|uniref:Holliday junction branch migration complex subunit RuvA n=1 Tax=Halalkalibacillus sediminis TaxID=2018042 RepID=A0A2I0QXQ5_9BACI|nr:Holliday junction branch migration protein RuvA [Halalkalibacillus sediminis]PKR79105.1 Holliday junction branch migration protein RuvA [Halalkalibacillus sediminis]